MAAATRRCKSALRARFVRTNAVNATNLHIDQQVMDAVGRMGGHTYARTRDQFDVKTVTPQEWQDRKSLSKTAAECED